MSWCISVRCASIASRAMSMRRARASTGCRLGRARAIAALVDKRPLRRRRPLRGRRWIPRVWWPHPSVCIASPPGRPDLRWQWPVWRSPLQQSAQPRRAPVLHRSRLHRLLRSERLPRASPARVLRSALSATENACAHSAGVCGTPCQRKCCSQRAHTCPRCAICLTSRQACGIIGACLCPAASCCALCPC